MADEEALIRRGDALKLIRWGGDVSSIRNAIAALPAVSTIDRIEEQDRNIQWLRLQVQNMHRRAQKAEGLMARTGYILEAIRGYLKARGGSFSWHSTFSMIGTALDHARRGSGRAMSADCHWYLAEKDAAKAHVVKLQGAFEKLADAWRRGPTGSQSCSATYDMDAAIREVRAILKEKANG